MVFVCADLTEDLSAFIDGELEQASCSVITNHLSQCFACKRKYQGLKNLGGWMRQFAVAVQTQAPDLCDDLAPKLPTVCQCVEEDLSAYLDGELIASAKEGINQHLDSCVGCLQRFHDLSKVNNWLASHLGLPESTSVDIWAGVSARLNDDCLLISADLSAFLDREIDTLRHRDITAHL